MIPALSSVLSSENGGISVEGLVGVWVQSSSHREDPSSSHVEKMGSVYGNDPIFHCTKLESDSVERQRERETAEQRSTEKRFYSYFTWV